MKHLFLAFSLLVASTATITYTAPKPVAYAAAGATWLIASPTASLLLNTSPTAWTIGYWLLGNDLASRYALGGIVGGTVGTLAAVYVFKKLSNTNL